MKRTIISLVLLTLLVLGAAQAQDAREVTVGISWNAKDNALPQAWEDYMKLEADRLTAETGITFNWVVNVADADPARQAANIEDLINQGVDIILARAEDGAAIGASIRAANDAGIPFITFDRESTTTQPAAHVGGDSYDQGLTTGYELNRIMEENGVDGKCIELQGSLTDENAVNRSVAWNEVDAESDVFETVAQVPTEWNPELFLSGTTNALQANPEANCMFIASDFAIGAVQSALESAGRWAPAGDPNHMWLGTQDVFPDAVPLMREGYIDVATTYDAFEHSKEAVRVMVAILNGEDPGCEEGICLVPGRVATPDTVDTLENLWSRDYNPDGTRVVAEEMEAEATEAAS